MKGETKKRKAKLCHLDKEIIKSDKGKHYPN